MLRAGRCRWQDTRCGRADAAGQDAHTQCCTVRSPQHCLSWVAPPATERQLPWLRTAAADVRNHGGGAVGRNTKCTCDTQLLLPSVRKALRTLNRGKICATCMIRGVCAAKRVPSWQDIHVVYPPTAICRTFRIHGAHILPKPAHFEYTAAIYCHEEAFFPSEAFFWGTSGQNIAIVRHLGTHNVNISPPPGAWECISRARGNAVGCRQHRLRGQLRCKSTNEPVHSNIFPLRYCYRIYLLHNK